jgi:hypothetical protein
MTLHRVPLLAAIAMALIVFDAHVVLAQSQAPVDANPAPPPAAAPQGTIAPATPDNSQAAPQPGPAGAAPSTYDLNQAARDPRTLNPLLIPTDEEISDALTDGRELGKTQMDFIDLLDPAGRAFQYRSGGMFGERRRPTGVAVWVTPNLEARWLGFIEEREFATQSQRDADFAAIQSYVTAPQRTLTFLVEVGDVIPGHQDPTQAELDAGITSLAGTHFVLSDDHDNNYDPDNVAAAAHLLVRQDFYDAISPGPDHMTADAAFATPAGDYRDLVKRRKPYMDYAAFYIVTFNAFNPDGGARVNRDVHTLTLRIVTPDEPKFAVFDVSKMP